MPQMAPLNWLSLMIFFSMTFIMFNILNYYTMNYTIKKSFSKTSTSSKNWKW